MVNTSSTISTQKTFSKSSTLQVFALLIAIVAIYKHCNCYFLNTMRTGTTSSCSRSDGNSNNYSCHGNGNNRRRSCLVLCCADCSSDGRCENKTAVLEKAAEASPREMFVPKLQEMLHKNVNLLASLKQPFEEEDAAFIATLIFESMYTKGRIFHSMRHVFNILEHCEATMRTDHPMVVLMTLFHDLIYYSVDRSFQEFQLHLLEGILLFEDADNYTNSSSSSSNGAENDEEENNNNSSDQNNSNSNIMNEERRIGTRKLQEPLILSRTVNEDPLIDAVVQLFGFGFESESTGAAGTVANNSGGDGSPLFLPELGRNEFLSAVIGARIMSKWLSTPDLIRLTAGIEATIPFRPVDGDGKTAMDWLYDRLSSVTIALQGQARTAQAGEAKSGDTTMATTTTSTSMTTTNEDWLVETVRLSATMANCDVCSLSTNDRDFYLDSLWSLIPENRPNLIHEDCSLQTYSDEFLAVGGRTKFLESVVPDMFHSFRGIPSASALKQKQADTLNNLEFGHRYVQVRRLQALVLVEFVIIIGEDPNKISGRTLLRIGDAMDPPRPDDNNDQNHDDDDLDDEVRKFLEEGRNTCFPWDPAKSSLGLLLYNKLGQEGVDELVEFGKKNTPGSGDLLHKIPAEIVDTIAHGMAEILGRNVLEIIHKLKRLDEAPLSS
mmetsp:Transcript_1273/g.2583  ORF Transcript_1273/g.2583 Transcript_1273/m.2583 type:complete len:665 (-) Transcript_1273:744-2738(-)